MSESMKVISINKVFLEESTLQIIVDGERFEIDEVCINYRESKLFSFLEIETPVEGYIVKGVKSIWEFLLIFTYDVMEKREDNKIYDLYCCIGDSRERLRNQRLNML